jgi:glycosyltransferase involved in cell wall biosynthesis
LHVCLLTSARLFEIGYGGIEKYTTLLGRFLINQNFDVTLLASGFASVRSKRMSRDTDAIQKEDTTGTRKIRLLKPPYAIYSLSRYVLSIMWIVKLLTLNRQCPITLIHAQDTGHAGLAAVIAGKVLRIPVVLSSHGLRHKVVESYVQGRLKNIVLRLEYELDIFTAKHADKVIVSNPSIKEYFEQRTVSNIRFIPTPIRLAKFEFSEVNRNIIRKELRIDERTKVVGFVGRLVPIKNLLILLTAFANLAENDPSVKLVLVGSGYSEAQLKDYVNRRAIQNRVIFLGTRYDIERILAGFDIFVLPSLSEGLPTALLEAMACGRAIICSDIPANCEVVSHDVNGLIFKPHDVRELEKCIRLLSREESLRTKLGTNARRRATEYDENVVLPSILQCYKTLTGRQMKVR